MPSSGSSIEMDTSVPEVTNIESPWVVVVYRKVNVFELVVLHRLE